MISTYTMRIDDSLKAHISAYASAQGKTMDEFMIEAALDAVEDADDLREWEEAYAEYKADPVTYSMDEVMKEFGMR